jgi:SAM-dependent methyltransferase
VSAVPFDEIGERYDTSFLDRTGQLSCARWLIDALPVGARVLDHGCGTGLPTALQLHEAGMHVVGTDESTRMLEMARDRVPDGEFLRRDLRDLDDDLGSFDAVTCFFALLMLPRKDIPGVLAGLAGRLRPGGLLALSMVLGDFDMLPMSFLGVEVGVTCYPPQELTELVEGAGFEVLGLDEVTAEAEPGRPEVQLFVRARRPTAA